MKTDLKALIDKLNSTCRRAMETAAALCVSQTNYNVEVEHLLLKLLEHPDTDVQAVLRYYEVSSSDLLRQLNRAIETFKRGNSRTPAMSPQVLQLLRESWQVSSLQFDSELIRSGAVLTALLDDEGLRGTILESCPLLAQIPRESLRENLKELTKGSSEATARRATPPSRSEPAVTEVPRTAEKSGATTALDKYTIDIMAEARAGKVDPIRGRDPEIRQVIDILTRRRQNNPILVGEAGVGKTAVAEGFALRVISGGVPKTLKEVSLRILDLGLLQAGAGVRGEFEERLKSVISEVEGSPKPIILFIDEAHTLIGAGGAAGQGDAANLLKPALARGQLRTIAATTWSEYKRYIEKDPALARRFQVVKVEEPDEDTAIDMLRGVAANLERHHKVLIPDEAVRDAVRLSHRYMSERRLPDKAVSVLDTACARVAVSQDGTPPAIEDVERQIQRIEIERGILEREETLGASHAEALRELTAEHARLTRERETLSERWKKELEMVQEIGRLERELDKKRAEVGTSASPQIREVADRIIALKRECEAVQGLEPMVPISVDSRVVASVISGWTGIPTGRMLTDEVRSILTLKEKMEERIVGQAHALDAISRRISTSRASLEDPGKPKGVFLLVGPSGVGKTETAITLAEVLYGGSRSMVTVNMSEFQEAHTVATLKGAPPGYVGYGKGGVLTEAVRRKPYSVVLLDEMEKAHSDVAELFYQVFDKGMLEDGEGVQVDFKNTVILLTSNVGTGTILRACQSSPERPSTQELVEHLRPELLQHFKAAFLGRMVVVPYFPLGDDEIRAIVKLKLSTVEERIRENHRAQLTYDPAVVAAITERCTEVDSGARNIDQILTQTLLPELSTKLLERMAAGEGFSAIHVLLGDGGDFAYEIK